MISFKIEGHKKKNTFFSYFVFYWLSPLIELPWKRGRKETCKELPMKLFKELRVQQADITYAYSAGSVGRPLLRPPRSESGPAGTARGCWGQPLGQVKPAWLYFSLYKTSKNKQLTCQDERSWASSKHISAELIGGEGLLRSQQLCQARAEIRAHGWVVLPENMASCGQCQAIPQIDADPNWLWVFALHPQGTSAAPYGP